MKWGRIAVLTLALVVVGGGVLAANDPWTGQKPVQPVDLLDDEQGVRRDDDQIRIDLVDEDDTGDGDNTRGDDGTNGGNNTGDGDNTRGDDGTNGGNNTGDGGTDTGGGGGGTDTGGGATT